MKTKCDICSTEHGGFHLCLGRKVDVVKEQYEAGHGRGGLTGSAAKSAAAGVRWSNYWDQNADRDRKIFDLYQGGASLVQVGKHVGLSKTAVRAIVLRLGGEMRSRNQKAS